MYTAVYNICMDEWIWKQSALLFYFLLHSSTDRQTFLHFPTEWPNGNEKLEIWIIRSWSAWNIWFPQRILYFPREPVANQYVIMINWILWNYCSFILVFAFIFTFHSQNREYVLHRNVPFPLWGCLLLNEIHELCAHHEGSMKLLKWCLSIQRTLKSTVKKSPHWTLKLIAIEESQVYSTNV